jgi:hypothetical protein
VHRIGGGSLTNLRLKPKEAAKNPPEISVLLGGTPQDAARQMRTAYPRSTRLHALAAVVGTATAEAIRQAGFEVIPDPSRHFPNHACIIHPQGIAGFDDANLTLLSQVFQDTAGC